MQLNPSGDVAPQDYDVPVTITYPDGTEDTATLKVTVTERDIAEVHDPAYAPIEVVQTETGTVAAPTDSTADAEYSLGAGAPKWATLNKDGSIEVNPDLNVEPGEYTVPVEVTYSDGSTSTVELKVNVEKQGKPSGSSGSSSSSGVAGSSSLGKFFAALFGTIAIGAGLFGLYNWARDHGYVR